MNETTTKILESPSVTLGSAETVIGFWQQRAKSAEAEVASLRHQLATHDAKANSACQEWDVKCERLVREAVDLREQLAAAESTADKLRTMLVKDYSGALHLKNMLNTTDERIQELEQELAAVTALVPEADLMKRMCGYAINANMAGLMHANHNTAIIIQDTKALHILACAIRDWREE